MTPDLALSPSRGRLFKIFTDLGPYFRKSQSAENNFFFDCLEVCVDASKEPEKREFLGWWLTVTRNEDGYTYQRSDGMYDVLGDWVSAQISSTEQQALDDSFELFVERLKSLIDTETGFCLTPLEATLTEA